MTRKRIGTGLLEAFSHTCDQCGGRGLIVSDMPVEPRRGEDDARRTSGRRTRGGRGRGGENGARETTPKAAIPSPRDLAAVARPDTPAEPVESTEQIGVATSEEPVQPVAAVADPVADTTEGVPDVAPVEPESDLAPAPVPEPVVDATPEPAGEVEPTPEPEPVRVVTRSRRRSASRPAGPPVVGAIGEPPLSGSVEPGTGVLEPGTPEPAGAHPGHDEPHVEHVPIKKKGTRKR
jgi:ribonuclease E